MYRYVWISIWCVFAALLVFTSCKNEDNEGLLVIKGKFSNSKGELVYLEELGIKDLVILDSIKVDASGEFEIKIKPNDIGFYVIKVSPTNFFTLLADKGEEIELSGDITQLARSYKVKYSPGSYLVWQLDSAKRNVFTQFDSLKLVFEANRNAVNILEIRNHLDSVANHILSDHKLWLKEFMDDNPASLANLIALWQTVGNRPMFTLENDLEIFENVQRKLSTAYPEHPHSQDLARRVLEYKKLLAEKRLTEKNLNAGNKVPDIKLPDIELRLRSLSELREKIVLLYFWASRNTQSRYENVELVELYRNYHLRGFEIFQVSLDTDIEMWKTNVRIDKLKHIQVYGNEQVKKLFNLETLPRAFLIDTAGVILVKDITVDELKLQLRKLYPG
jgi:peroxiredoxin